MKTYIINLERSETRRETILQEARKHGLDYEFIKAVDGLHLSDAEMERLCDMEEVKKFPQWLTRGMIGACLSHYNTYQKLLADDQSIAFVIEDDVVLPDNINEILSAVEQNIGESEIVLLGFVTHQACRLSRAGSVKLTAEQELLYPVDLIRMNCAAAYVITGKAARSLSEIILPVRAGSDSWGHFHDRGGFESLRCVYPMSIGFTGAKSAIQYASQSTLRARVTKFVDDYRIPPFYQILKRMRLKNLETLVSVELVDAASPLQKG